MTTEFIATVVVLEAMLKACKTQWLAVASMTWLKMLYRLSSYKNQKLVFYWFFFSCKCSVRLNQSVTGSLLCFSEHWHHKLQQQLERWPGLLRCAPHIPACTHPLPGAHQPREGKWRSEENHKIFQLVTLLSSLFVRLFHCVTSTVFFFLREEISP